MEKLLIKRLKQDDIRAFDTVYELYARRLLAFCLRHVPVLEDAEEIVQDVFIALWYNRASIRNTDTLYPLLFTSMRNRIYNYFRSRINAPIYEDYVSSMAENIAATGTPSIEYRQFYTRVLEDIDKLPPTQREVVRMSRLYGLSHKEIADKMGLTIQSVTNALSTATKTLRLRLHDLLLSSLSIFFAISEVLFP